MQAVSGSRGARIYDASELDEDFEFVSNTIQDDAAAARLPNRSDTGMWVTTAGINIRDQVRANDNTPLQFKYEAADCRMYYTIANIYNMTRLWQDVAAAAWTDPSLCVAGSTGYPSARNSSSPLAPPPRTAVPGNFDFDVANFATPANNSNGQAGMQAGPSKPSGAITGCPLSSNQCTGTSACLDTGLKCGSGLKYVKACLPRCTSADRKCPNTSECVYDSIAPSKLNAVAGKSAKINSPVYNGHCRPSSATNSLPCPK
jgi:hypothetical protein